MIAWILILLLWGALLWLILHDVTDGEIHGSAVLMGSSPQNKSSSSMPDPQDAPNAIEQAPAPPSAKKSWWRKDRQVSVKAATAEELELAISESVKTAPGCEDFIGVFVRPKTPQSPRDPNWELRGVRYGNADRALANEQLATTVARLQQELQLADQHQGDHPTSTKSIASGGVM